MPPSDTIPPTASATCSEPLPPARGDGHLFTLGDIRSYLKTTFSALYRACEDAQVAIRYERVECARGHRIQPLPMTAEEAKRVILAYHSAKAIRKGRPR